MKFKKTFIFICLIVCLFSMASIYAGDVTDEATVSEDTGQIDLSQSSEVDYEDNLEMSDENDQNVTQSDEILQDSYSGEDYNLNSQLTDVENLSEGKIDTVLIVPDVVCVNGTGSVAATLKDIYGNAVSGVNVKIAVGDLAKTLKTDENGQVALDVSTLAPGTYTATIKSASSAIYNNAAQIKANVTVNES